MEANLCFGFLNSKWPDLKKRLEDDDENAWSEAIGVFERRMRERFFSSIDALVVADTKPDLPTPTQGRIDPCIPGFSIMALCCILIETLQGFRGEPSLSVAPTGPSSFPSGPCVEPPTGTGKQFKLFLRRPAFDEIFHEDKIAQAFVDGIRNGILHEAETRKWVIWRDEPVGLIAEAEPPDGFALNRTLFYHAIKKEFESYLQELREPSSGELRKRFMKKMNDISKKT
jgi:hypothetical protein